MRISDLPLIDEVKNEYISCRQNSIGREAAVEELMRKYKDEIESGGNDDAFLFWIGIADAQYALRELSDVVARRGAAAIDAVETMDIEVTPGDLRRRRERYAEAPMPERQKVKKPKRYRCPWRDGDTFAYQLTSELAKSFGLYGRYVIFRKVDALENQDGLLTPIVTVTLWDEGELPHDTESFQRLPLLILARGRLGLPRQLCEYRLEIIITSERKLKSVPLIYLGNFADVPMPDDEVIIRAPGMNMMRMVYHLDESCCWFWKHQELYRQ